MVLRRWAVGAGASLVSLVVGAVVAGQTSQGLDYVVPRFEVASVKPNLSSAMPSVSATPGRFVATNQTVRSLITIAYRIPWFRILGGPDWLSERFDIAAKMPDHAPAADLNPMIQRLMADRFNLQTHSETRQQPVYALLLAQDDGRLGPRLQRSTVECSAAQRPTPDAAAQAIFAECQPQISAGHLSLKGVPLQALANWLSGIVGDRVVVDRTGLDGPFDVGLTFAARPDAASSESPSIFTAVREQLGLKLEPSRGSVEVLVIDHIERPDPN